MAERKGFEPSIRY